MIASHGITPGQPQGLSLPYYIAYIIHSEVIWVLAIAHSARRPEYWITRGIPQ